MKIEVAISNMFLIYIKQTFRLALLCVVMLLFIRTFVVEPGRINGRSMEDTFLDEDFFLVNKFSLLFREPKRGDLVQAMDPINKEAIIKRIVGLPGERLAIHDGHVYLVDTDMQETLLVEPYVKSKVRTELSDGKNIVYLPIPTDSYFLLGDNRPMSTDSRIFGWFHRSSIFGLVMRPKFSSQ